MKKILTFTLFLCCCACAFATDWQSYGSVYIDNHTIFKTDQNTIQAWIIHPDFAKSKLNNTIYTYESALFDAKCSEREMAILNRAWYNKYHQMEFHPIDEISYEKIKPKTNNEVIFKAICAQSRIL